MDGNKLTTAVRRRLYAFADGLASLFSDSRRSRFVHGMIVGLVISRRVLLTSVARAGADPNSDISIHAAEKRLSRNLASEHWDVTPLHDQLLRRSAEMVTDDTLIVADTTDLAKEYAKHLERLGKVHDGSDPQGRITNGYCLFEAYARIGRWQHFPLKLEPLKAYTGAPTSENIELLGHILSKLRLLSLNGTGVTDDGLKHLEGLTQLRYLDVKLHAIRSCVASRRD